MKNEYEGKISLKLKWDNNDRIIKVNKGENLLKALRDNGVVLESPCGGKGTCGKCKVFIKGDNSLPSSDEINKISPKEIQEGIRLACKVSLLNDIEVAAYKNSFYVEESNTNILTWSLEGQTYVEPVVIKRHIVLTEPSIKDQRDDLRRIKAAAGEDNLIISYDLLQTITKKLRQYNYDITLTSYKNIILTIEKGDTVSKKYGVAVDIGTTTIAAYLVDLNNGKTIDSISFMNKQRGYGADVISRINFTMENENGSSVLRDIIVSQINEAIEALCSNNSISECHIYNLCIVGNTTMLHMLLGLDAENIAMAPYIPVFTEVLEYKAQELGININGHVTLLPCVASYVGSDIAAGILSSGMVKSDKPCLLIDIGTNGEMALGSSKGIIACSVAAGPALEGANIKWGMGGVSGAICNVDLSKDTIYRTIDNKLPIGICGSGVIDTVSELLRNGVIDETGRMVTDQKEFVLAEASEGREAITFTQKDVREVQLAKAAVYAGIILLLQESHLSCSDIDKVYMAGGFGNFMSIESAVNIGLIPKALKDKVQFIGNSAGNGAKEYLISKSKRKLLEKITEKISYLELSAMDEFQDIFIEAMGFNNILEG